MNLSVIFPPFLFFLTSDYCGVRQRGSHRRVPQKLKYKFYIMITILLESAIRRIFQKFYPKLCFVHLVQDDEYICLHCFTIIKQN